MEICTLPPADNHISTPLVSCYKPDALPSAQPTASEQWRQSTCSKLSTYLSNFGFEKLPTQKFGNFSCLYAPAHRLTSVVSEIVLICTGYVAVRTCCIGDTKTFSPHLMEPLWRFPPMSYMIFHCCPSLIFKVLSKWVQVWENYNGKLSHSPQKWLQYSLFEAVMISGAFSALTLLVGGRKGIWPAKSWVVGCWHGYVSGSRCRFAYGSDDATATYNLLLQ